MSFKENLKTKIRIDRLAKQVGRSFRVVDGISKVDRDAAKQLLSFSPYRYRRERDLDLYVDTGAQDRDRILVLDNDLPIYQTSAADVALRKSPTVKEMISFKNVRKILSDADVVISRKQDSVAAIRQAGIDQLDLSFQTADIEALARDGRMALESADSSAVQESLSLFAELLGYTPAPPKIHPENAMLLGKLSEQQGVNAAFGPLVVYRTLENTLKYIDASFDIINKEDIDAFRRVITENTPAEISGAEVFGQLAAAVLRTEPRSRPPDGLIVSSKSVPENGNK